MTRIGSLCSGYGGLELGLIAAVGGSVAWHVEYDKHPSAVLEARFPGVPNYGDITTTDWTQVEPVDWLTAGYPCQPFSHAGKRKGKDDERHLWPFVAGAIGVLRPRRVLLENVRGHVSLGLADVLADLSGLGYDAQWGVVRAADAGAPHNRARIFIVATDTRGAERGSATRLGGACGRHLDTPGRVEGATAPGGDSATPADARGERHGRGEDGRSLGRLDREDAGQTRQRERARAVAGDRSAADEPCAECGCAEWVHDADGFCAGPCGGECTDGGRRRPNSAYDAPADTTGARPTDESTRRDSGLQEVGAVPRAGGGDSAGDHAAGVAELGRGARVVAPRGCPPDSVANADGTGFGGITQLDSPAPAGIDSAHWGHTDGRGNGLDWGAYTGAIHRWEAITGRDAPRPTESRRVATTTCELCGCPNWFHSWAPCLGQWWRRIERLDPRFVEWMMGLPAGWVTDVLPRAAALKALGNGVVPQQAALAVRILLRDESQESALADGAVA